MKASTLILTSVLLSTTAFLTSPLLFASDAKTQATQNDWQTQLSENLPVLGHRNFIVIADSAYPQQSNPGIKTIYTGGTQIEVLKKVLAAVDDAPHVNGTIYVDKELTFVPEHNANGIEAYRTALDQALTGRDIQRIPHMEIIKKLDASSDLFNVVILKTDLTLPYTSVFIELGAGYWNEKSETELRESMK
ncbi:RbsD/FucU domain-containing protein [Colwelliaceae bacterium BS250]